jgi:Zn-dependent peptidase ImmA (M78 family)
VRCCNLEGLLADDDLELASSDFSHAGYAACLVRTEGCCGIILSSEQAGGRRRFSIAHELGHYHIPSHSTVSGFCTDADLSAAEGGNRLQEWEANDFAAELLMPRRLFAADANARNASIATAVELAGDTFYDVSIMAATLRIVDTTRHAAAIVVSANGRVVWTRKSDAFTLWLPGPRDRVHEDTMAAASFRQVEVSDRPKPVPIAAWVDRSAPVRGELLESTYRIDRLEQVVSLLWYVDADDDLDEA